MVCRTYKTFLVLEIGLVNLVVCFYSSRVSQESLLYTLMLYLTHTITIVIEHLPML